MLNAHNFCKHFLGYNIEDCEIRNKNIFYFIAREDYTQWTDWEETGLYPDETALKLRTVVFFRTDPESSQWSHGTLSGFERSMTGLLLRPKEQLIVGSIGGDIYSLGSGEDGIENNTRQQLRGGLFKIKTISDITYVAGGGRTVGWRNAKNDWTWCNDAIPFDHSTEWRTAGFRDLDGFSPDDLYAAGGRGEVWHCNAGTWRQVDFPSNTILETVCCGNDGRVYISGYEGLTFVGRGDTWKKVKDPNVEITLAFQDMVWFEDRVWCTNDYGVWWIINDELVKADIPAFAKISCGHLCARDGVLLLAGFYGAALFENGQWHQLFDYMEMVERCKAEGLYDGVLKARWHEFKDDQ